MAIYLKDGMDFCLLILRHCIRTKKEVSLSPDLFEPRQCFAIGKEQL